MANEQIRAEALKRAYDLERHVEGGWFSEVYTAPFEKDDRALAGSIYFLLDASEISHFHQIDCDEIWYYHEGCGMRITLLYDGSVHRLLLGGEVRNGERAMVVIPKGGIFAAENLREDGYTFVSCATVPKFDYTGFRLVNKSELQAEYGSAADEIDYLAYS